MNLTISRIISMAFFSSSFIFAEEWRTFTNTEGRSFEGRVTHVDTEKNEATVLNKKTNRVSKISFAILSAADVTYLRDWKPAEKKEDTNDADSAADSSRLYPKTKEEIRDRLSEIEKRKAPKGISQKVQDAVNSLNQYRYLCGVPEEVEADKEMVEQATDAAQACKKNGELSHDIGHSTDICNLANGADMRSSVQQYIDDFGPNNKVSRGHRRWCLNPPMGKTGFGEDGAYSAMVSIDQSGKHHMRESWAYPGKGFFPKKYVHGNAWSLYLTQKAPKYTELKVEVYELKKRPEKAFSSNEEIPGKALPVVYISCYENAINFEPQDEPLTDRGIYWVRINGGGVSEGYVVELY